jgi:hypothetical protein
MSLITPIFATTAVLAALLATVALWSPRRVVPKLGALALSLALLPTAYAAYAGLLSKPKPVELEWWLASAEEATVLASSIREGEGIYLWLQLAGVGEPRSYVLPWDRAMAEQLQEAMREAARNESGLAMRLPFEPSLDDREPRFYALPQPAMPPKDLTDPPPMRFAPEEEA